MFTQKIIDSDAFLDMPLSTQALYFHLNMRADDDGFVNNPKRIQRTVGASEDDLKLLIAKRFLICFENGVIVIKHWRMHNTLKNDRYRPTQYQEEYKMLEVKDNKAYTERQFVEVLPAGNEVEPVRKQPGTSLEPQYSIDIDKDSKEENSKEEDKKIYIDVIAYLNEKAGTNYRASSEATKKLIRGRLAEGYTLEDFKTVIDTKCAEWLNTDYAKFLRPSTLFQNSKFEGYLNQKGVSNDGRNQNGFGGRPPESSITGRVGQWF